MANIPDNYFTGGTGHAPTGTDSQAPLAEVLRDIADDLKAVGGGKADGSGAVEGLHVVAPTTPSSQAAGVGNTDFNADVLAGVAEVDGAMDALAATADLDIHSGSFIAGFTVGTSVVAAVVVKDDGGIAIDSVLGTPATSGSEVAPTDAEIQAAIGAAIPWARLGNTTLQRTADTTVVQTYDRSVQERSLGFGGATILTQKV